MQVSEFEHLAGKYSASLVNAILKLDGTLNLEECKAAYLAESQSIRKARATLRMLGLEHEHQVLEQYIEYTRELHRHGVYLAKERAEELSKLIVRGPGEFYSSISKSFLNPRASSRHS